MQMTRILIFCLLSIFIINPLIAEIRVNKLFCDHMVLQQEMKVAVWGTGTANQRVSVLGSWGKTSEGSVDEDGRWKLFLQTPSHGGPYTLSIQGEKTEIQIKDVLIGEVWLCAGQSNMGWSLGQTFLGDEEAQKSEHPNYRIFKSQREHWHEPLEESRDRLASWKKCNAETASKTSAVSYYFGKKLHQELGIPIGIIVQAFAGTPIEGWMPWEIQNEDPRTVVHKKELDDLSQRLAERGRESLEKSMAKFEKELSLYNQRIDKGETMKSKLRVLSPPIITKPANLGHQYPQHIYNAMIHPIRPFGIRGMIWYQGERNSKTVQQASNYKNQLALLIEYYRSSWFENSEGNMEKDFPFFFTQLPSWHAEQKKPVEGLESPWVVNREMMRHVTQQVPKTGMAVSIDTGDAVSLHPKNKKPIGIRHAYLALKQVYNFDLVDYGPRYEKFRVNENLAEIEFSSIGSGIMGDKGDLIDSFALAGEDKVWHWASGKIQGNKVVVSSPEVNKPVAVRYAWAMNPSKRNLLYNKEGIPASPFRTDDWPLFEMDAEEVMIGKPAKDLPKSTSDWSRPLMTQ